MEQTERGQHTHTGGRSKGAWLGWGGIGWGRWSVVVWVGEDKMGVCREVGEDESIAVEIFN